MRYPLQNAVHVIAKEEMNYQMHKKTAELKQSGGFNI